ncbi:hypothetical protein MAR_001953 [Mya arenaria]|uniref:Uncharacterized protein n=1 Tax=Mya arenaria TaxID=6604 RepID=A0ABY7FDF8_MYAAR|nr:hypothetical protein MAR_001953 [Mya arenaria]
MRRLARICLRSQSTSRQTRAGLWYQHRYQV